MKKIFFFVYLLTVLPVFAWDVGFIQNGREFFLKLIIVGRTVQFELTSPVKNIKIPSEKFSIGDIQQKIGEKAELWDADLVDELFNMLDNKSFDSKVGHEKFLPALQSILKNAQPCRYQDDQYGYC